MSDMPESTKIERLWAPWRLEHIQKSAGKSPDAPCVFCELAKADCNEETLKLYQSEFCFIVMNRFPYNPNHLLIIPNEHVGMVPEVKGEVWSDLTRCLKGTIDLLMANVKPHGVNVGLNMGKAGGASIPSHLHFHVLPRWEGDTNFLPLLAETRMLPVHNVSVFRTLQPFFADFKKYLPL